MIAAATNRSVEEIRADLRIATREMTEWRQAIAVLEDELRTAIIVPGAGCRRNGCRMALLRKGRGWCWHHDPAAAFERAQARRLIVKAMARKRRAS